VPLPTVDLRRLGERRRAVAEALSTAAARVPIDLERGPALTARLLRLDDREHLLALTTHHIVFDGSLGRFLGELARVYGSLRGGRPAALPELPVQYADFAAWQRRHLTGAAVEARLEHWRRRLAGAPPLLELPTDRPRPPIQGSRGARLAFAWPAALLGPLQALARRRASTLYMTVLGGLVGLLYRLSGQADVVIGSPVADRPRPEVEDLVGCFVNTVVLRIGVEPEAPLARLVDAARDAALEAFVHQDLPFEMLVDAVQPQRSLGHSPLFQVMFVLRAGARAAAAEGAEERRRGPAPGLAFETVQLDRGTARFDLLVSIAEQEDGATGAVEYAADLFDDTTVRRWMGHLRTLLAAAVARPDLPLEALPLLAPSELHQLRHEWNDSAALERSPLCLHELFALQAERRGDAPAVVWEDGELSYRDLAARVERLARLLRRLGVAPGSLVGVYLERGPDMAAATLAVVTAGGGYVPLDARLPAVRVRGILEELGSSVAITGAGGLEALAGVPSLTDAVVLGTAAEGAAGGGLRTWGESDVAAQPAGALAPAAGADDVAYVIFTSGSTGRPKGVMVQHRPAVHLVGWVNRRFGVGEHDRLLFVTSLGFDLSVYDLFGPLAAGGSLRVAGEREVRDPDRLTALLRSGGITIWDSAPAGLQQLVPALPEADAASRLRLVLLSGDWIPLALPDQVRRAFPGARVVSLGGATEATIWSNFHEVGEVSPHWVSVPYGRPIPGARYHVVDRRLAPCPPGVAGDLLIGGGGLAAGYAARPRLTAERFVPDPFAVTPGARVYRTGDRARYGAGAVLEILGRVDQQVKVRGFRVELGEVEAALAACPGVREAAVTARGSRFDRRLAAYVVADDPSPSGLEALRTALARRLPEYMVPTAWVPLDRMPTTASGKIDRRALPEPPALAGGSERAAATPAEELVAQIFADVLGVPEVGPEDGFFELGGHSLLAMQALARLREAFASDLPLRRMFEQPTAAGLAAALTAAGGAAERTPLVARPADAAPVLSPAQERLWFLHQLEPESPAYNVPLAFRFAGRLDAAALAAALAEVVRRHQVLRTRYPAAGGRARPEVMPASPPPLPRIELAALPAGRRERELGRIAGAEARRPFDLATGPVLRARVVGLEAERGALLVTVHHVAADAWSMGVLVREVSELYSGHAEGRPAALPELPVQYADYALWQRERLAAGGLDRELGYWRRALDGAPTIELPTDRPRPAVWSPEGASRRLRYGRDVADAVAALARREGATPFMVLLAAFDVLLARWTGARDLPVGTPVATRSHPAAEPLVGLFLNTLVVLVDAGGDPSFRRLLARVRGATLASYDHRELPFERLVEELQPRRDLGRSPLFQVMLILHNAPLPALDLPGLELSRLEVDKRTARFDWTLTLAPADGGLAGSFEYSAALFDPTTVERAAGHLGRLLRAAAEDPDRRLSELPLWSAAERHQVHFEWNDSAAAGDRRAVHRRVAEQAGRHPGRTALIDRGRSITYGELAARVERAAARLAAAGIDPGAAGGEVKVGLLFERSAEMVIGLLAALSAGAAYVPLDPGAPPRRLAAAVADAGLSSVLAGPGTEAARPALGGLPVIAFDDSPVSAAGPDAASASAEPSDPPRDALAYVLFTSGSTGRPKGVQVTHGALANLVRAMAELHRLRPGQVWAAVTPLTFDISAAEILVPLVGGAAVDLVPREVAADGARLARRLAETGAAVLQATPATWWLLLESGWDGGGLGAALCGGEAMPQTVAAGLVERVPAVWNYYGPTETTIWSSVRRVRGAERAGVVPVGRPLANTSLAILDPRLRPLPAGVPGELAIGGAGLARGYLGLPAATAERFVPDPVTGALGGRLYRTGDLARRLPSGDVEFLGRLDQQVKVRGFRIEPGEVEAALTAQPGVRQAVVVARASGPGDARLVAYLVAADPAASPEPSELRRALRERLPDYMVPSAFEVLDALPLGATGKVDRRALPEPRQAASRAEAGGPERSAAEEVLAAIWADVLHHPEIGPEDDFFALGGHSLLATQVTSRAREAFGVEVPVRTLFAAPTLAACAAEIERARRSAGAVPAAPPLVPEPRDGLLPLSFAQQRLWVAEQLGAAVAAYTIPHAVRLDGALRVDGLAAAFGEIVRRHEVLRTVYPAERGVPVQRIAPPSPQPLPVVDLSALGPDERAAELERAIASQGARRFDLAAGPLLRTRLLRLATSEHALAITMHHIASDGWSRQVLEGELRRLYAAFAAGRPSPLAEPPIQYADYAAWQRRWLAGPALDAQLEFWRGRLAGMPPTLDLPFDRPRPEVPTGRGGRLPFALSAGLTATLRDLARRRGASLFMVLLAGFSALLRSLTGRDDLVVGTDIANRTRRETEGLIGFFVNELVLRSHLSGNLTFGQALERVRETALDAYAHQDLPFERLLDALDLRRTLRHSPLYQVKLILQNAPRAAGGGAAPAAPGAPVFTPLEVDAGTAKFDLAVFAYDVGEELRGSFNYRSELFDRATVEGFRAGFEAVLAAAARRPEATLAEISDLITEDERSRTKMQAPAGKRFDLSKIKAAQPKAVAVDPSELVRRGFLAPGQELPLVVEPALADADLAAWAAAHRAEIENDLARYGAVLFRGFGIADEASFERFAGAVCDELFDENGEHESLGGHVQTPVFYSPEKQLLWHNENSFNQRWPRKIIFGCAIPAATGGETTIVDSRRVYRELPDELRRRFEERGVAYLRNAGGGLGRDWRTLFGTDDRAEVEEACRRSDTRFEWRDGGERLRTWAVRPAAIDHPATGERCWFNQAQHWHLACLDPETRRAIEALHSEEDLPRHCTYGDGTPIDDADMATILGVYQRLEVGFPWRKGDVMLVDNVLVAHGRNPFTGQRKLLVALGDMHAYRNGGEPS
jgi:amino acid adenylation domain-containing protein